MTKFINKPNLPQGNVSLVAAGKMQAFLEEYLLRRKIKILKSEDNIHIDPAIKSHIDMSVVHIGGNLVVVDVYQEKIIRELQSEGFEVIRSAFKVAGQYPDDVKLNVGLFGDKAVGAFKYTDSNLISAIEGFHKFDIKQGYAKCSFLPINENAAITDDETIYNSLKNAIDILLVRKGDISLDGHDYGFIGGASAKISKNEILFFGDLNKHRDCNEILSFLEKYDHKAISFNNYPLYDIGGLVTLCEI